MWRVEENLTSGTHPRTLEPREGPPHWNYVGVFFGADAVVNGTTRTLPCNDIVWRREDVTHRVTLRFAGARK